VDTEDKLHVSIARHGHSLCLPFLHASLQFRQPHGALVVGQWREAGELWQGLCGACQLTPLSTTQLSAGLQQVHPTAALHAGCTWSRMQGHPQSLTEYLAPPLTSARVGAGWTIMDSSMLVATMTGLPRFRHPWMILFCLQASKQCEGIKHATWILHPSKTGHHQRLNTPDQPGWAPADPGTLQPPPCTSLAPT
jgi:hypothetical protein